MDSSLTHDPLSTDDSRVFIAAAFKYASASEAARRASEDAKRAGHRLRRSEAIAIAALDGFSVRAQSLARLISDPELTGLDRGTRKAADAHRALQISETWQETPPRTEQITEVFRASDESSGRISRPETEWTIEEDSLWLSEQLASFHESADPWTAAETLRSIWASGRFFGTSRRMAMLCAPWITMRGFGALVPLLGLTAEFLKDSDLLKEASRDRESWASFYGVAVEQASSAMYQSFDDAAAISTTILALCPPGRSSSSIRKSIGFLFKYPVFSAKDLATALDLTDRGAKVVLDRLEAANVVSSDGSMRNRKFQCHRTM